MNSILFLELSTSSFRLQTYLTLKSVKCLWHYLHDDSRKKICKTRRATRARCSEKFCVILARSVKKHGVRIKSPKNRSNQIKWHFWDKRRLQRMRFGVFFFFSYTLAAKWCHITYTCVENYITKQKKNFLNVKNSWIRTLEAGEQERQKLSSDWLNQIAQVCTVRRASVCDWLHSARGLSRTCHECTSLAREKHRCRCPCQISPHSNVCGVSWFINLVKFHSPLWPRTVDSFAKYAYSCRICPLEFFYCF